MSLYYEVGQKLICPIGKLLLHTMQINISFKLIDRLSYSLLHLSLQTLYIYISIFFVDQSNELRQKHNEGKNVIFISLFLIKRITIKFFLLFFIQLCQPLQSIR
jgi:hypothetical protein